MKEIIKEMKRSLILTSILYILLGLVLVIWPDSAARLICYCLGAVLVIFGIVHIINYFTVSASALLFRNDLLIGLTSLSAGLFLIFFPGVVISFLPFLLGLIIVFGSFVKLQHSVDLKRIGYVGWWIDLLLSVLTIALGLIVLFNPFTAAATLIIFIGISFIVEGFSDLWTFFRIRRRVKEFKQDIEAIDMDHLR